MTRTGHSAQTGVRTKRPAGSGARAGAARPTGAAPTRAAGRTRAAAPAPTAYATARTAPGNAAQGRPAIPAPENGDVR